MKALFSVAYRPFFLCGALGALLSIALWFAWLEAQRRGAPPLLDFGVAPARVHALLMIWGVLGSYVLGFLGTAFPRWVQGAAPGPRALASWLALLLCGQLLIVAGALDRPAALALGAALIALVMASFGLRLAALLARSRVPQRLQPASALGALALGAAGLLVAAAGILWDSSRLYLLGRDAGIYGFLLVLVAAVGQRVLPFFVTSALGIELPPRPRATLPLVLGAVALRIALASLAAPALAQPATALLDLALGVLLARELASLRPWKAAGTPLLAVLFLGQLWVLAALAGSGLARLAGGATPAVELALLHALLLGGFSTLVLGISTRVALGHGGRPLAADPALLTAFGLIQLAALLRVLLPLGGGWLAPAPRLSHWAALPWCAAFALWLARIGPLLLRGNGGR